MVILAGFYKTWRISLSHVKRKYIITQLYLQNLNFSIIRIKFSYCPSFHPFSSHPHVIYSRQTLSDLSTWTLRSDTISHLHPLSTLPNPTHTIMPFVGVCDVMLEAALWKWSDTSLNKRAQKSLHAWDLDRGACSNMVLCVCVCESAQMRGGEVSCINYDYTDNDADNDV